MWVHYMFVCSEAAYAPVTDTQALSSTHLVILGGWWMTPSVRGACLPFIIIHLPEISLGAVALHKSLHWWIGPPRTFFNKGSWSWWVNLHQTAGSGRFIPGCRWFLPADELTLPGAVVLKLNTFLYFEMCLGFINVSSPLCSWCFITLTMSPDSLNRAWSGQLIL